LIQILFLRNKRASLSGTLVRVSFPGQGHNQQALDFSQLFPMKGDVIESTEISRGNFNGIMNATRLTELTEIEPLQRRTLTKF
jgi:hypothetical protein